MSAVAPNAQHFYGHLLPLQGRAILLPKQAMVEAVSMETVTASEGPEWFLGYCEWQDRRVPAVSIEAMLGGEVGLRGRRTRVAILNSVGSALPEGLFAVMTTAYPHLLPLNPLAVQPADDRDNDHDLALARVRLANREAFVPDLEEIEKRIAAVMKEARSTPRPAGAGDDGGKEQVDDSPLTDWEPSIDLGLPDDD
ncbi:MAG: hypothetical protein CMN28_10335 [Salinisphaeraceae bacterium]|nr:hypothetical protein [Salinisphaeraceae bacterium]